MIRDYPELKQKWQDAREPRLIAAYGEKMPSGNSVQRATENLALRELSPLDAMRFEIVDSAIAEIKKQPDGCTIMRIVELMDWKRTHTANGVAIMMHFSERTIVRKRERLIKLVAKKAGWL